MYRPPYRRAVIAALLVLASTGSMPLPSTAGTPAFAISFRVTQADGSDVPNPIVMTSVFGRTYPMPHVTKGSVDGVVRVAVPMDDPVVVERLAVGEPVNLMIRVFDRPPGRQGITAAYIGAAVGRDDAGALVEESRVEGSTFRLQPGLTAFEQVSRTEVVNLVNSAPIPLDDDPDCPHFGPGTPVPCHVVDYPLWSRNTWVPIADNHGAGPDLTSNIRYHSTHQTKSSFAVQAGKTGFVQADGAVGFEKENEISLGFAPRGNGVNRKAYLVTEMVRTRSGACYQDFPTAAWECQLETTYRPNQAHGSVTEDWPGGHQSLDRTNDCWTFIDGHFGHAVGETERMHYSLSLGPSENWATITQSGLYANTTVTGQTHSGKSHIRTWDVTGGSYPYHYLYVPGGLANFDRFQMGGGPGACVEKSAPEIRTEARATDLRHLPEVSLDDGAPPPDGGYPGRVVCGRMPDKCD